ncbi:tyrosine-type recombinase/integrase [Mediterraneibacter gnavus]|uniref:tyrosine-type recombinase/integrase n=1 Tax=Mediterraneibacter gnavus TaxID=33038 RepID=UPI003563C7E8
MKNRIHLYELECYKSATQEKRDKMRVDPNRYFNLEGLPSESIQTLFETVIWERGKTLSPSSLNSELTYFNNIREFVIDKGITELKLKDEERILRMLKGWMLERGYALSSQKYCPVYDRVKIESPGIIKHMKKILSYAQEEDERDEQEKDIWELKNFDFLIRLNPVINTKTINFTKIVQPDIREEVKKTVFMHLKFMAMGSIQGEMAAINRFSKYLEKKKIKISSLQELDREHIEQYLIYLKTEANERKNYRTDLYSLRRVIEDVGNLYERPHLKELFLNNDFPSTPRYLFKFYSDETIKRLNKYIFQMDEQVSRSLIIHQLLGTRISETLTLRTDCLSIKEGRYFIRIIPVKSASFEKAISDELAQLIRKAMEYTKERYGETEYIFVNKKDPTRPYQYAMIQNQVMTMIRQKDIRDENGELLNFGTHIFRHCYGKKLTEMNVEDWMIAKLLGHKTLRTVHHYRRIGNKMMADETRKSREKMDMILLDVVKGWDGYEI